MSMKKMLAAAALAAAVLAVVPAHASTVPVKLRVSAAQPVATATVKLCNVSVALGADGIAVLNAAVASGCIRSYATESFGQGRYVSCLEGVCETPGTYWRMTENGAWTAYGVDGFRAAANDELGFSYTTWVTCWPVEVAC